MGEGFVSDVMLWFMVSGVEDDCGLLRGLEFADDSSDKREVWEFWNEGCGTELWEAQ